MSLWYFNLKYAKELLNKHNINYTEANYCIYLTDLDIELKPIGAWIHYGTEQRYCILDATRKNFKDKHGFEKKLLKELEAYRIKITYERYILIRQLPLIDDIITEISQELYRIII